MSETTYGYNPNIRLGDQIDQNLKGMGCEKAECERRTQVREQLELLSNLAEVIAKKGLLLEEKLAVVLTVTGECQQKENVSNGPQLVPLALDLVGIATLLVGHNKLLDRVIKGLEL